MKTSEQCCRIGKSYKVIRFTKTCFSHPPLVKRLRGDSLSYELDYNAICKQCGKRFIEH